MQDEPAGRSRSITSPSGRTGRRSSDLAILHLTSALDSVKHAVEEETTAAYNALKAEKAAFQAQREAFEKERAIFEEERALMARQAKISDVVAKPCAVEQSPRENLFFDFSPEVFLTLNRLLRELQNAGSPDDQCAWEPMVPDAQGEWGQMLCCRCSPQAWNPLDKGPAVVLGDARHISSKHTPSRNSLIRGKVGYTEGKHYFKVKTLKSNESGQSEEPHASSQSGHHILGVATENAPLEVDQGNPGEHFWGLHLDHHQIIHGSNVGETRDWTCGHEAGTEYGILLDMDKGTLSSIVNGQNLGVLFSGLPKTKLYPAMGVGAAQGCIYETNFLCAPPVIAAPSPAVLWEPSCAALVTTASNIQALPKLQVMTCEDAASASTSSSGHQSADDLF